MSSLFSRLINSFSEWREKRRIQAEIRRKEEEQRRRQEAEARRREEEYRRAMYRRGNDFEDYVRDMFPDDKFKLIHRTPTNDETGGRYVHSMIYPDLRFKERSTGKRFWVEVKYRSYAEDDGSIVWCADNQLTNYKRTMYETREKVFIIMGVGGTVQHPARVYCLDLDNIHYTRLYYGTYKDHRIMFGTVDSFRQLCYISSKRQ